MTGLLYFLLSYDPFIMRLPMMYHMYSGLMISKGSSPDPCLQMNLLLSLYMAFMRILEKGFYDTVLLN